MLASVIMFSAFIYLQLSKVVYRSYMTALLKHKRIFQSFPEHQEVQYIMVQ